ncbi:helicase [Erysipelothrix rhusiopathiae]|nr:helicase [Erysipelothrix rhusiopathiae]
MNSNLKIVSILIENNPYFQLVNNENNTLNHPRIQRILERYNSYFEEKSSYVFKEGINYISLLQFIETFDKVLSKIEEKPLQISEEVEQFIKLSQYAINEHQIAGRTIKNFDQRWSEEIDYFKSVLNEEISRPLVDQQIQASFYLAMMKRAANFSVPGAGKTAMMYGSFAYLSSNEINDVDKILIVCPLNAFEAWQSEFLKVFGDKKELRFLNLRNKKYNNFGNIRLDWGTSNVIVINYESLEPRINILNELIDARTMIVFDEVHRVKGVNGRRAKAALRLGKQAQYHYVLTGTPIPNTYKDIYNFLHLLYDDEYDSYFGWDIKDLENPDPFKINDRVQPFFWRTNKEDLKVPKADEDNKIIVQPNSKQLVLVQTIYENEKNILALYLRLLQASTNPALLLDRINYYDLGFLDDEIDLTQYTALSDEESERARVLAYKNLDVENIESNKFNSGISLILDLVSEGKKVIVWGMFVKTMYKIVNKLKEHGVSVNLVYGGTPKDDRVDLINQFRDGSIEVLVSNPNTLGEAISLHQTVHDAVYFEYNFNLTFMLQSRDRIHRLGLPEGQYTRYYYLMTDGDRTSGGFIDQRVYSRLKEKESVMLKAIDGEMLVPEVTDNYLEDVKKILDNKKLI